MRKGVSLLFCGALTSAAAFSGAFTSPSPIAFRSYVTATKARSSYPQLFMARADLAYYRRPVDKDILAAENGICNSNAEESADGFQKLGSFEVFGQGAVGFKMIPTVDTLKFRFFAPIGKPGNTIECQIDNTGWTTTDLKTGKVLGKVEDSTILNMGHNRTFWMSFDKEHSIMRCGVGYMLTALELFNTTFRSEEYLAAYSNIADYSMYKPSESVKDRNIDLVTSKYPINRDLPALVKDSDKMTMEDLDSGDAISIGDLSPECQRLYGNVAGMAIQLDTPDFPDFSAAIENSIKNGLCATILEKKAKNEFVGGDPTKYDARQTYLRVTLGTNQGDSPGIPYVMEIWPPACYSPIHDHGATNAIIKVLYGSLTTRFYASVYEVTEEPYGQSVLSAGQVTWLDDRQFQTHQLFNHNTGTTCVTIQCYLYNDDDDRHYKAFDYIGGDSALHEFVPDSDWDYAEFKKLMREEWAEYKAKAVPMPKIESK
jgi:predicted metal-dependent enzyme (double-stranded beta helix superfamily)